MPSLIQAGESWLRSIRRSEAANSPSIAYSRGAQANNDVPAIQAETRFESDDGETIVNSSMVDWLIERADLTLGDQETLPVPGDEITVAMSHGTETFIVAPLGREDCFRWHGRDGQTFRIHTVRTSTGE